MRWQTCRSASWSRPRARHHIGIDILASANAILSHLGRGSLDEGLVFDAVRVRRIEIGEAVKDISTKTLATEPDIRWRDVAGMRDQLAHHYFDTTHGIAQATVDEDLPPLVAAVQRILVGLREDSAPPETRS